MTIPYDLAPAAEQVAMLAAGVTADRFGDPTPCPDWSVATVLVHFLDLTEAFTDGARKKPRLDTPETHADQDLAPSHHGLGHGGGTQTVLAVLLDDECLH